MLLCIWFRRGKEKKNINNKEKKQREKKKEEERIRKTKDNRYVLQLNQEKRRKKNKGTRQYTYSGSRNGRDGYEIFEGRETDG
jgi:hypothetical protein